MLGVRGRVDLGHYPVLRSIGPPLAWLGARPVERYLTPRWCPACPLVCVWQGSFIGLTPFGSKVGSLTPALSAALTLTPTPTPNPNPNP